MASGIGEPIAVVGMACRFPGANDLAAFWRLLEAGEDAVSEGVPGSGEGRIGELFPRRRRFRTMPVDLPGSSTGSTSLTPRSSGSRRWRPSSWIPSSG